MIAVPQPTIEKPLTAVDYIAVLANCGDFNTLTKFAAAIPEHIVEDDRFAKAFRDRLFEVSKL